MHEQPDLNPQFNPPSGDSQARRQRMSGSTEVPEQLRAALVGYEVSMEHLRAAVLAFVADCKRRGLTAEQMVPEVRRMLETIPRWSQPSNDTLPADMTVIDRAVQWAIEAFYEPQADLSDESRIA